MRLYGDLANWFHLLTAPGDYEVEAARYRDAILEEVPDAVTLLELGSGGGNNASHLRERFTCTLVDVSPQMLSFSRTLNPGCEHVLGDMRTLRLGRTFDAVFVHDAVMYLDGARTTCARAWSTAFAQHPARRRRALRPGLHAGDASSPAPTTEVTTATDGRALRHLEWTHAPEQGGHVVRGRLRRAPPRARSGSRGSSHDRHVYGLFPGAHVAASPRGRRVRRAGRPRRS